MKATVQCPVCTVTWHLPVCLQRLTCYFASHGTGPCSSSIPPLFSIPRCTEYVLMPYGNQFSLILPKIHVKYMSSIIRLLGLLFTYFFFLKCPNCSPGCVWIRGKQSAWASLPNAGIRWVRYHIQLKPFPFSYKMLAVSEMTANMVFFSLWQQVQ